MITNVTYKVFTEQIQRRLQNDFPSSEFTVTDNEVALYIYQALASVITALSEKAYAVEGLHSTPEGLITTFKFTSFTKDSDTGCYKVTLPHPPVNLPLGYSIISPYFTSNGIKSYPLIAIQPFQKGYAFKMATPDYGAYYEIEGNKMIITSDGFDIINSGVKLFVPMLSPRGATGSDTDTINASDETLAMVFDQVVARLSQRVATPKDANNDGSDKKTQA